MMKPSPPKSSTTARRIISSRNISARRALRRAIRCAIERQLERLALIEEKDNYYGIFDHLVEGIFRTTPDGHYLLANVALAHIYGYDSPMELMASIKDIGKRLYVEPGRREEFVRLMQEHDTMKGFESLIYRKDGLVIWISENCRAVRDAQGKLLYYEGTVEDITQRRQMEQELRNSESLYHSLVETMPQNVFRKDLQGRFTFANQQYCKHYKCKLEDILGKTDFDFFPKELAEKYQKDDQRVMETGQTYEIIEEHQPLGQEKTIVQVVKTPLYGADGSIIGLQGIFWDITAQKLAEEQIRRANAELARSREELRAKNLLMEENLHMAREIQSAMLPQQYPVFPAQRPAGTKRFSICPSLSARRNGQRRFFQRLRAFRHGSRRFHLRRDRPRHSRRARHRHDSRAGGGIETARARPRNVFAQAQFRFVQHPQNHRLADAHHRVLSRGRLADRRHALRQRRPSQAAARAPFRRTALNRSPTPPATASPRSACLRTRRIKPPKPPSQPGDLVMLFTDGLYEVQGPNEELYSQERMMLDVAKPAAKTRRGIVRRIAGSHPRLLRGPRIRRRRLPRRHGIHRKARLKS